MSNRYPEVNPNPDFPAIEKAVLAFWEKEKIFQKSIENRPAHVNGKSNEFIFYDGPPFANGLPHYGHLLTGFVKDLFARYQTMKGKRVERRFGWDCHGLPAEMGSEKELGISGRQAIIKFGIEKFNAHCRQSVMKYTQEWQDYVTRQARWVDFKNDYKTMNTSFMESVLWAFKQLYDKGLIYEAYRVMPYSWAAETPLSNFETKLDNSYREREDKAITVAFELKQRPHLIQEFWDSFPAEVKKFKAVAWTTTPWTLPSNLALAVSEETQYSFVIQDNTSYIVADWAAEKIKHLLGEDAFIHKTTFSGAALDSIKYISLFPYFSERMSEGGSEFSIIALREDNDFIEKDSGTGIVHMAPGFGEDDQKVCEANGISIVVPVDGQGKFTDQIFDITPALCPDFPPLSLKGLNVIAEPGGSKFGLANDRIIDYLKKTGQLIKQEQIKHNYPHCWRTDQPLIYRAMPSWYVEVTKFRDRAVELNKDIDWIPAHVRDGQMGHMLATAPDWSISRNRFWGTPIPVWRSKSGKIKVYGSIAELEKASGKKITDLHRPFIDDIIITEGGEEYRRVEDVFDCWFESGSMPFAQVHYPFENKEWFEHHFPANFITEYVGQTRGWFNTLIMLATALFDKKPFSHCICHGVVLDAETGLKYSKRLKNYKDPMEVIDQYGADALRWLMIASPVMRGLDLAVDPQGKFIRDVVRLAIKPIWNAYNFFSLYANADGIEAKFSVDSTDAMDRYILAKCKQAVEAIEKGLDSYDTPSACEAVSQFFEALNNWYIRRNKGRFWKGDKDADKQAAYDTLFTVLTTMCQAAAPLLPLTCEDIYKGLTGEQSVHLAEFPDVSRFVNADQEMKAMDWTRDVCNVALAIRNKINIRVRQPLNKLTFICDNSLMWKLLDNSNYAVIIAEEVNVKEVNAEFNIDQYATPKLSINNSVLGKRLPEKMKQIIPASKKGEWKQVEGGVEICGEKLLPGEYTLQLEPKPEYKDRAQALSTNDALVILDTTVTPELEAEGIARDVVRMIQQARKDAALNVSDRINLHIDAPESIAGALKTHRNYVMEQTLSVELSDKKLDKPAFSAENTLDDQKIVISFALAA